MQYAILGRTGLRVSTMGCGCGPRFGKLAIDDAAKLVETALELGVNLFDTAPLYGESESLLGRLLCSVPRDRYVLNSKYFPVDDASRPISVRAIRESVEQSLLNLNADHLDVLQLHGVRPTDYRSVANQHLETLFQLREEGKFRFLGITETIRYDPEHAMLPQALRDNHFEVAMVAYNLLIPTPKTELLPLCQKNRVGVVAMTAARPTLRDPERLKAFIRAAVAAGRIPADAFEQMSARLAVRARNANLGRRRLPVCPRPPRRQLRVDRYHFSIAPARKRRRSHGRLLRRGKAAQSQQAFSRRQQARAVVHL